MQNVKHNLKCLALQETIFTLQKCYVSNCLMNEAPKGFNAVNHVLIQHPSRPSQKCVCKLYWCTDLHPSFCHADASVVVGLGLSGGQRSFKPISTSDTSKSKEIEDKCDNLFNMLGIEILPPVINLNYVEVTPVMDNVQDTSRWNKNSKVLLERLTDILKLYTVTNDSVVCLKNLKSCQRFGIHSIIVHGFGSTDDVKPQVGRITSLTKIHISKVMSKLKFDQLRDVSSVQELGGLDVPYQMLTDIVKCAQYLQEQPAKDLQLQLAQHVLLIGPPGCGKTSLVRRVSSDCGAVLIPVLGPELCRPRPGDTEAELRRVFDRAILLAGEGPCVLLLDEVDSLCPKRGDPGGGGSHLVRVTSQLLALLERANAVRGLVVVATTNRPNALDAALRTHGRLAHEIHIGVPTEIERAAILTVLLTVLGAPSCAELCRQVACWTAGYVGADLALVCQDVAIRRHRRAQRSASPTTDQSSDWIGDFRSAVSNIRPSLLRGGLGVVTSRLVSLANVGGLFDVKQALKMAVDWPLNHPDAFARLGLPQPRGVLLYGPPGCAKTTIAQAVATANNTTFLSVSAAELYSPFVGDAEKNIGDLFHRARLGAPSIIFIDEIDALVGSRGEREKGVQERVLSALLTEMDGIGIRVDDSVDTTRKIREGENVDSCAKESTERVSNRAVIVIAATNRPDMLDAALLRPGRFDKLVHVPAPDTFDRADILRRVTAGMPLDPDVDIPAVAEATRLFSGADLNNLAKEAGLCALTDGGMDVTCVNYKHFRSALDLIRPSLTQQQVDWYVTYSK